MLTTGSGGITPNQIVQRAMQRLDAKGRGILLLHDIHPATAMALPSLLKQLKDRGYRVVHVVPAGKLPESVPDYPLRPPLPVGLGRAYYIPVPRTTG